MTTSKKNKLKRAALSWLCVAALTTGANMSGAFPGIIPAVTAEAANLGEINLSQIKGYLDGSVSLPTGVTIRNGKSTDNSTDFENIVEIVINPTDDDSTLTLSGSNYIEDS